MRHLRPLEPESLWAYVPPSHGSVQLGRALDFLHAAAHMPKTHAGSAGNRTGQGCMARQAILTRTAQEWGVM